MYKLLPKFANISTIFIVLLLSKSAFALDKKYYGPFVGSMGLAACQSASGGEPANACVGYYFPVGSHSYYERFGYPPGTHLFGWHYAVMDWDPVKYPDKGTTNEKNCSGPTEGSCKVYYFISAYYGNCPPGSIPDEEGLCNAQSQPPNGNDTCGIHNPIFPEVGNKFQKETDLESKSTSGLNFIRYYSSAHGYDSIRSYLGLKWRHNHDVNLDINSDEITFTNALGARIKFMLSGSNWIPSDYHNYSLIKSTNGTDPRWIVKNKNGQQYWFTNDGLVYKSINNIGQQFLYEFIGGQLSKVSTPSGDQLTFQYVNGLLDKVILNESIIARFEYTTYSRLSKVYYSTIQSPTEYFREYLYSGYKYLLRGIIDEAGKQYSQWTYDSNSMLPILSARGTSTTRKEKHIVEYVDNYLVRVTNPYGQQTDYHYELINNAKRLAAVNGASTTNCAASNAYYSYDANGFQDKVTDRNGNVTDYDYSSVGLVEQITEGLVWSDPATRTTTTTTPETRTTELDWIDATRQIEEVRAPGITTHYDYWPNNRLKQVTKTDTSSLTNPFGTTAGQQRITTYAYTYYNGQDLPVDVLVDTLTIDGPLPGTTDQTVYQYDQQGHLLSITNALGQTQTFSNFNGRGQAQTITDANGVVTELGYHPRGWLETVTVKDPSGNTALDSITQYTWYPNGTLEQLTFPDGSFLHYEYNDARHLIEIRNNLDEVVEFVPDAMGNWTTSRTKDPSSNIKRLQQRAFDELGRLMDLFGNNSQHTHYDYDTNGNVKQVIENSGTSSITTTLNYDTLDRLKEVLKPINTEQNGQSVLVNVDTEYGYDGADNLTSVTDPKGNTTTYVYNGFGEKITQISPDTGTTHYWYDEQGNLTFKQDARNVTVQYHYDDLGRLTWIQYPNSVEDVHYYYDEVDANNPYALGKLTRITDQSGSTAYTYDHRGNLTQDTRVIAGQTYSTGYGYNLADKLTQLTYPSGRIVHYYRNDALGRISAVTTQRTASDPEQSVISGIQYLPFGPIQQYTYGNGLVRQVPYDLDYRIDQIQVSDTQSVLDLDYGYDAFNNITSILDNLNSSDSQTFTYDDLHRLQHAYGNYGTNTDHIRYEYDPVGNRTLKALSQGTTTHTTETYAYAPLSNQLNTVTLDTGGSQAVRSLIYNDAGALDSETTFSGQSRTYGYNDNLRLIELNENSNTLGSYQLNALGQRISKTTDTGTEVFHYSSQGLQLASTDSQGNLLQEHLYLGSEPIAVVVADPISSTPTNQVDLSSTSAFTSQDSSNGSVESSANSITLTGNRWRYVDGAVFNLSADALLEFDMVADGLGEIQGIGFDTDHSASGAAVFKLSGTQSWGNQTYSYTGGGSVQHIVIPVGQHYTGENLQLLIVNDKDSGPSTSTLTISNVTVCESNCGGTAQ